MARVGTLSMFIESQRRARSPVNSWAIGIGKCGMIMHRNA